MTVAAFFHPLTWVSGWRTEDTRKDETIAGKAITLARHVHDLGDWAEAVFDQGIDKFIRQPKRPSPIYTFPTTEQQQHNFRDVAVSSASAATADGRHLRPDVITRMDAPREADRARFAGKIEIDLRASMEKRKEVVPSWRGTPGFAYQPLPIEPLGAYNALDKTRDLAFARTMLLLQSGNKLIIHCTHGVDRTGMDIALTMMAVGYSKAAARNEYLVSGQSPEGPQADPEVFDDAIDNTLKRHGGTMAGYIDYLNGLLRAHDVGGQIDVAQLRTAVLQ